MATRSNRSLVKLLPFHDFLIQQAAGIHVTVDGATVRALNVLTLIGQVKIPAKHCPAVRDAVDKMLDRLGGENNRRFKHLAAQRTISRAQRALQQQIDEVEQGIVSAPGLGAPLPPASPLPADPNDRFLYTQ